MPRSFSPPDQYRSGERENEADRMLIVDDEAIVQSAMRVILRRTVDIVDKMSAEEALRDLEG